MIMAHKKKNVEIRKKIRPKKGFNPNPFLQVSREELDRLMREVLINRSKPIQFTD